ncbi:MAG: fructose-6-phosphate aldolase, partial [Atopobiaceae bacterium]|nr:fructose-6-phosphate aldolase [Atopobiaceae bacterium]
MKLMLDTADLEYIKRLYDYMPLDGVTTNPSILARTGRKPFEVLHEIREFIGPDQELFVQTIATDWE